MTPNERVRFEREGDVAVVLIDNPPINAGSRDVRRGLLEAVARVAADDTLRAAVVMGAGATFVAGADLREFGRPLEDPQLPAVIAAIEACPKPFVAALHGAALGGGFELALGCDARVAAAGTVVGLPEVTLGIIPGAGGTQRVPRLVGVARAIAWTSTGERIALPAALAAGLVDREVAGDLRAGAVAHARTLAGKRRVRDLPVPPSAPEAIEAAQAAALKAGKGRPAVRAAIERTRAAATEPIEAALARERAVFQELRVSREAFALRHQFFAERDAAKHPSLEGAEPREVARIAVLGAGTMGSGIAIAALEAGLVVDLLEQDAAALQRGADRIAGHFAERVQAGKMAAEKAASCQARLAASLDWACVSQADLAIEAVFEEMAVKREVFARLDRLARPGAVLATNTSYLDIDAMAAATSRPGDVIGLHFFSPANVMRLLEVVRGKASSREALATGLALGKRLRKVTVLAGNAFGFIGNRIYNAYRRQCEFLVEEGAAPHEVDAALEAFGYPMGPFAVADLSGLDIAWRMRRSLDATRDPRARYVAIPDRLVEAGRLGRKSGAGYYRYAPGGKGRAVDPAVQAIIEAARAAKGVVPRAFEADEIRRRILAAMANEAALVIAEGVAERATDIDVVMVNGYGFPRWEGGPVFLARERGAEALASDFEWLEGESGPGFVRGDAAALFSAGG